MHILGSVSEQCVLVDGMGSKGYLPNDRITSNIPGVTAVTAARSGAAGWKVAVPTNNNMAKPTITVRMAPQGEYKTVSWTGPTRFISTVGPFGGGGGGGDPVSGVVDYGDNRFALPPFFDSPSPT